MAATSSPEYVLGLSATGWSALSAITAVPVGIVAIVTAFLLVRQLKLNSEISAQELGWRLWSEYLAAVISHPEARDAQSVRAAVGLAELNWDAPASAGSGATRVLLNKYRALIEFFLNASDGLLAGPTAQSWALEVREHARRYGPDLLILWTKEGWERRFNKRLSVVIEELKSGLPAHA